jgi:hypothetical protein
MIRSAYVIRAIELDHPSILGMELFTDRLRGEYKGSWFYRGEIDSVVIDIENRVVTVGVNQRDYIHMDAGQEVLLIEKKKTTE